MNFWPSELVLLAQRGPHVRKVGDLKRGALRENSVCKLLDGILTTESYDMDGTFIIRQCTIVSLTAVVQVYENAERVAMIVRVRTEFIEVVMTVIFTDVSRKLCKPEKTRLYLAWLYFCQ